MSKQRKKDEIVLISEENASQFIKRSKLSRIILKWRMSTSQHKCLTLASVLSTWKENIIRKRSVQEQYEMMDVLDSVRRSLRQSRRRHVKNMGKRVVLARSLLYICLGVWKYTAFTRYGGETPSINEDDLSLKSHVFFLWWMVVKYSAESAMLRPVPLVSAL